MTELLQNASLMVQGVVVAVLGLLLVFAVLVLFFFSIRILGRIGLKKNGVDETGQST